MAEKTAWAAAVLSEADINTYLSHTGSAWNSYTPTFAGTTLGNGTVAGAYFRAGRLIVFRASFVLGSSSAVAGPVTCSLPVTSAAPGLSVSSVHFVDAGVNEYPGMVALSVSSTTVVGIRAGNSAGTYVVSSGLTSTVPWTWATSDAMYVNGVYESAA